MHLLHPSISIDDLCEFSYRNETRGVDIGSVYVSIKISSDSKHQWMIVCETEFGYRIDYNHYSLYHLPTLTKLRESYCDVPNSGEISSGIELLFSDALDLTFGLPCIEEISHDRRSETISSRELLFSRADYQEAIELLSRYSMLPKEVIAIIVEYGWGQVQETPVFPSQPEWKCCVCQSVDIEHTMVKLATLTKLQVKLQ